MGRSISISKLEQERACVLACKGTFFLFCKIELLLFYTNINSSGFSFHRIFFLLKLNTYSHVLVQLHRMKQTSERTSGWACATGKEILILFLHICTLYSCAHTHLAWPWSYFTRVKVLFDFGLRMPSKRKSSSIKHVCQFTLIHSHSRLNRRVQKPEDETIIRAKGCVAVVIMRVWVCFCCFEIFFSIPHLHLGIKSK